MVESRLINPPPLFKLFGGTEDERKGKLMKLAQHLKEDYLMFPDEYRNYIVIYNILAYYNLPTHLFYEFGNFSGIIGFTDIIEGHKADIFFKIWDKSIFNKTFMRQLIELYQMVMDELSLKRLNAYTADERMVKLAEIGGFKIEGKRIDDFSWNGAYYDYYFMGRMREE